MAKPNPNQVNFLHESDRVSWAFGFLHRRRDSASSLPAWRASPVCSDEKSNLSWMFCRLSRLRSMSYSPLLSFGSSITVPGSTYLLLHLSVLECLTSFDDDVIYYTLC